MESKTKPISTEVVDGVAIIEWYEHLPDDEAVREQVRRLLERWEVEAYVAVDRSNRYLDGETQEAIERMAGLADESGIERVGFVGEAIKALAAKRPFEDRGLDVYMAEDREEVVQWARGGD